MCIVYHLYFGDGKTDCHHNVNHKYINMYSNSEKRTLINQTDIPMRSSFRGTEITKSALDGIRNSAHQWIYIIQIHQNQYIPVFQPEHT